MTISTFHSVFDRRYNLPLILNAARYIFQVKKAVLNVNTVRRMCIALYRGAFIEFPFNKSGHRKTFQGRFNLPQTSLLWPSLRGIYWPGVRTGKDQRARTNEVPIAKPAKVEVKIN